MPYKVKGRCIYKKDGGTKVGCTKGSVKKYLAALHANADESVEREQRITEAYSKKPDIFNHTIYRAPTKEELQDVNDYELNADEVLEGFKYTMIGRGILSMAIKHKIVSAIQHLCKMYPTNKEYKKALKDAKELTPRGMGKKEDIIEVNSERTSTNTKEIIKELLREKLLNFFGSNILKTTTNS